MTVVFPPLRAHAGITPLLQIQIPPIDGVGQWMWMAIGALGCFLLVLAVVEKCRNLFGTNPPIQNVLAGLATLKHVDASNERVSDLQVEMHTRSRGLEEQISALRHEMRGEYQATKAAQQELSEDIATKIHGVRDKIEHSFKELDNKRSASIGNLHGQLGEAKVRLGEVASAVAERSQATDRKIDSMDNKIDRLVERLSQKGATR